MMNEAPCSFNTTYLDKRGFVCQVTLRSEDGTDLVKRVDAMLDWLLEQDAAPVDRYGNATITPTAASNSNGHTGNGHGPSWCPVHQVEMKQYSKNGHSWYSHKTDDGQWCRGK